MARGVRGTTPKMGKVDAKGYAIVKDYCAVCGSVLYGYIPVGVPVSEPRCSKHREDQDGRRLG